MRFPVPPVDHSGQAEQPGSLRPCPEKAKGALIQFSNWFCLQKYCFPWDCSKQPNQVPVPTGPPRPVRATFALPSIASSPSLKSRTHPRQLSAAENQARTQPNPTAIPNQASLSHRPKPAWFLSLRDVPFVGYLKNNGRLDSCRSGWLAGQG